MLSQDALFFSSYAFCPASPPSKIQLDTIQCKKHIDVFVFADGSLLCVNCMMDRVHLIDVDSDSESTVQERCRYSADIPWLELGASLPTNI